MPIIRKLRVNGALYKEIKAPVYDPRLNRYTAEVERHPDHIETVYSRLPNGPFVFTIPTPENNQ